MRANLGIPAAGFCGIGLLSADLAAAEHRYGLAGVRHMLDDNGIIDVELEGIPYRWDAVLAGRRECCLSATTVSRIRPGHR